MKNGIIVTKKTTWTSKVEVDYLDETSPKKQRQQRRKNERNIGEKLQQFNDYADKDNLGRVYVGGFFHQLVAENPSGTFTAPANLPKNEVKQRLHKAWQQHLKVAGPPDGIIQHRFVISMSREQHDLLVKHGINPDTVLHERVRLVMKEFREKFHAGDSVGYAYGLHHDTDHLHAHVAVCPRSEKQQRVGLSEQLRGRQGQSRHKNQLAFIKRVCVRENEKLTKSFSSFGEKQQLIRQLHQRRNTGEYFFMERVMPPPLPTSMDRQTYHELRREHGRVRRINRQINAQRKRIQNAAVRLPGLPLLARPFLLLPELRLVRNLGSAFGTLLFLTKRLRQSQRALFHSRYRYFQLHQNYYNPLKIHAVNIRFHPRHAQRLSFQQSQSL